MTYDRYASAPLAPLHWKDCTWYADGACDCYLAPSRAPRASQDDEELAAFHTGEGGEG
jgi:hypothetical protein